MNLFRENTINKWSRQRPLNIYLSLSGDGGKLSKTGENQSSNFLSFCVQIIYDEETFNADQGVSIICSVLPWFLVSEKEEKQSLRKFGKWLTFGVKQLSEVSDLHWTNYGPLTESDCELLVKNEKENNAIKYKRPIKFSLLLVKGDSKFLQLVTGTTMGTSEERCYQCSIKESEWFRIGTYGQRRNQ